MTIADRLEKFEATLGYSFRDKELLETALTHKSYLKKTQKSGDESYQRLEFLGDRILALVIAELLFHEFPDADEGELARRLTGLVRNETCAEVASDCQMDRYVLLGEGERQSGEEKNAAILGDVCEAIIAAIFIDGGMDPAKKFILRNWEEKMRSWTKPLRDPKTTLQEWAHRLGRATPTYREVSRKGPDHALSFVMEVKVEGFDASKGEGNSKREAQQKAASQLLVREGVWERDDYDG